MANLERRLAEAQLQRAMIHDSRYAKGPLPEDHGDAVRRYRKAMAQGHAAAAANLGRILKDDGGSSADPAEAAYWFRAALAAGKPEPRPQPSLDLAGLYLEGRDVEKDIGEATRLMQAAARPDGGGAIALLRHLGANW